MSFHKGVRVRRKRYGRWWQAYGVADKIVSFARQTEEGIEEGDVVSMVVKGELKTIRVKGIYTYGAPPVKTYTFDVDGTEHILEAKGWKRTEIKEFDLRGILEQRPSTRWKGEWKVREKGLFYPVKPYPGVV